MSVFINDDIASYLYSKMRQSCHPKFPNDDARNNTSHISLNYMGYITMTGQTLLKDQDNPIDNLCYY